MLTLGLVSPVSAVSPDVVNIGVGTNGKYLVMNARLVDGFTEKILEAIENGIPMGFTFEIELRKDNTLWVDSLVSSNKVRHRVQFDSLKKIYRFSESGKNVKRKIITRKESRYQKLMLTLKDIPIAPIYKLDPNEKYYVRVKADLETDRFWFPFNYIFFFVPFLTLIWSCRNRQAVPTKKGVLSPEMSSDHLINRPSHPSTSQRDTPSGHA